MIYFLLLWFSQSHFSFNMFNNSRISQQFAVSLENNHFCVAAQVKFLQIIAQNENVLCHIVVFDFQFDAQGRVRQIRSILFIWSFLL